MPAKKPEQKPEYRTNRLVIRVTDSEKEALARLADRSLLCLTDFIRSRALANDVTISYDTRPVADAEMLGNAVGVMADTGYPLRLMLEQIEAGDKPLRAAIDHTLGRVIWASEELLRALGVVL